MRIIFADPDRELVAAYEKLLAQEGHQVVPAFDGVQVMESLKSGLPGLLVMRGELPLLSTETILRTAKNAAVPTLLLREEAAEGSENTLTFPFLPEELLDRIKEVTRNE